MVTSPLEVKLSVYDSSTLPTAGFMMSAGSGALCCSSIDRTYVEVLVNSGSKLEFGGWNLKG